MSATTSNRQITSAIVSGLIHMNKKLLEETVAAVEDDDDEEGLPSTIQYTLEAEREV